MGQLRKRGDNWSIDYRAYGKRYRECIGTSKKLAQEVLNKRMVEIAEGKFLDKKKNLSVLFEDLAKDYIELYSKNHKRSWDKDITRLKPLQIHFGGKHLHQITPFMIQDYISKRKNGEIRISKERITLDTINRELACLKHMFTKAVEWGKAEQNPGKKVKLFRENNERTRYLEVEEAEKLVNNCTSYTKRIVILALNTGMRKGEILSLKWVDIDFRRGIVYLSNTKNGERREIPMNEAVRQAFIRQPKYKDSPYVFCNKHGEPFRDIRKSFVAGLKKSGIINFRFHDLRHSFGSQLVMSGVDLNTVRELLGHKSLRMTLRYAHLSPAHKQRAVEVLGQKWSLDGHKRPQSKEAGNSDIENSLTNNDYSKMAR
ncbi:MAG: site-specific integrase [Candidatus Omnitrophota bacterium]